MLEKTMIPVLMAAARCLHHWAALLMSLLRWLFPPVLPTIFPWDVTQGSSSPPCSARHSSPSVSARLVKEGLRVLTYGDVARARREHRRGCGGGPGEAETCAVCLGELRRRDRVRVPRNCRHVYHRRCLDRWIDHDEQGTCPLCRAPLLPPPPPSNQSREQEQRCSWAVEQLLYLFGDDLLPPSPSSPPLATAASAPSHFSH